MGKGEDTRTEILQHAIESVAKHGLEGTTIGGLAKTLGMSKSGLFAHFTSKEALDLAVVEAAVDEYKTWVAAPTLKAPRGEPRLLALVANWLAYLQGPRKDSGCVFMTLATELDDRPGMVRERLVESERELLEMIATIAKGAVREGQFHGELDVAQFAWELHGFVMAYHHGARLLGEPKAQQRLHRAVARLLADARSKPS